MATRRAWQLQTAKVTASLKLVLSRTKQLKTYETSMYKRFANDDECVSEFHMTLMKKINKFI